MTETKLEIDVHIVQKMSGWMLPFLEATALLFQDLSEGLPSSPTEELEGLRPYSLSTDVRGSLECAVNDGLLPVIRIVREVRDQTAEGAARGRRPPDSTRARAGNDALDDTRDETLQPSSEPKP